MRDPLAASLRPLPAGSISTHDNIELLKLGYRIRKARKALGYSQKVFAVKCGLDGDDNVVGELTLTKSG